MKKKSSTWAGRPCHRRKARARRPWYANGRHGRDARATVITVAFLVSLAVLIGLVVLLMRERKGEAKGSSQPLMVYCAAGLREPMQAVADQYQKEFGVEVRCSFGASQAELVTLERAGNGDLYLPADESY